MTGRAADGLRLISIGLRHRGYPQDGRLWWVRWIDEVKTEGGGTGTPFVHVLLSALPEGVDLGRPPTVPEALRAGGQGAEAVVQVHPGDMPALSPGMLVRDGKRVGWLQLEERTFCFDAGQASDPTACRSDNPMPRPDFWSDEVPWTVLPASAYPLGGLDRGRCVVVHDAPRQLVLPCSEVFRFFFAPESLTANALLSSPFDLVKDRLLNREWTGPRGDGSYQVGLRSGLTGRSAASLANLAAGGGAAARKLFRMLAPGSIPLSDRGGAGMIEAAIPYDWTRMRISVRGLQLYPERRARGILDKFLGMVIVGVAWPVPPKGVPKQVHYRLDNNNTEPGGDGSQPDPPRPVGARDRPVATPDGHLLETADDPPGVGAEATFVPATTALIEGGPEVVRMPLSVGRLSRRSRIVVSPEDVDRVSGAERQPGSLGVGALRYVQGDCGEEDGAPRFAALAARLDELRAEGLIDSWTPSDPGGAARAVREGMPVWPFPAVDPEGGMPRRALQWSSLFPGIRCARTALVAGISLGGRTAHWLEIELRSNERGYRSVVFTTAEPASTAVPSLLLAVAKAGGKGPAASVLATLPGVLTAVRWKHGPGGEAFEGRRILDGILTAVATQSAVAS